MAGTPRWVAPALVVALLGAFATGLWGTYRAVYPARGLYRVTGVFKGRATDTMILVAHEPVAGFMEQMGSMALVGESKEFIDRANLHPGDRVLLTVRQTPDRLLVVEIQKIR